MSDYAQMYYELFRAVTRAIDLLQQAQLAAEERYMAADDAAPNQTDGTAQAVTK